MSRNKYPVAKQNYRHLPANRSFKMNGSLPNIFQNNKIKSEHATRGNRIHCVAVERTAIYKDANGNKIILKENQQTINTPQVVGSISFSHGKNNWIKK